MVDTGAGISIVDLDFAPGLGLQQNGEHEISGTPTTGAYPALRTDLRISPWLRTAAPAPTYPGPSVRSAARADQDSAGAVQTDTKEQQYGDHDTRPHGRRLSRRPRPGGFAAIIDLGDSLTTISGNDPRTTSGRMDLMAAPRGLEAVELLTGTDDRRKRTNLYTRSESLLHFFNQGRVLDQAVEGRDATCIWVRDTPRATR